MAFPAPADTYPSNDAVTDYLRAYAERFGPPVRLNARATGPSRDRGRFCGEDRRRHREIPNVVVATGPFHVPVVPRQAARLSDGVTQVHGAQYRNPDALPAGPVLVVGGGNSGFQIAEELAASRQVHLAVASR